jgi:hypothetical protein
MSVKTFRVPVRLRGPSEKLDAGNGVISRLGYGSVSASAGSMRGTLNCFPQVGQVMAVPASAASTVYDRPQTQLSVMLDMIPSSLQRDLPYFRYAPWNQLLHEEV